MKQILYAILNWLKENCFWDLTEYKNNLYLYFTELFELELFD